MKGVTAGFSYLRIILHWDNDLLVFVKKCSHPSFQKGQDFNQFEGCPNMDMQLAFSKVGII